MVEEREEKPSPVAGGVRRQPSHAMLGQREVLWWLESLSSPLTLIFSPSHSSYTFRESKGRRRRRRRGEELAWRPWSTIFFLISHLWRLGACGWSFVEDQTSTLLGFELGLGLLLRLDLKDSNSHLEIVRAFFAIGKVLGSLWIPSFGKTKKLIWWMSFIIAFIIVVLDALYVLDVWRVWARAGQASAGSRGVTG
uniref:Uncharacterized protein n=1 Tax=Ananas comosus var. bracteatus TaxID=296719 RepID=A0A6V7NWF2_ANACO|nr:unnamed protein product [Ananas comosus var. bracteatus]